MLGTNARTHGVRRVFLIGAATVLLLTQSSRAGDIILNSENIHASVKAGLSVIERSLAVYQEHRTCFSCHHQTLPMQAMSIAQKHGFEINEALFREQTELTVASFKPRISGMREGTGIGGKSMTVGFGLWTLDLGGWVSDTTTGAMIEYLLKNQEKDGHFASHIERPPLEDSTVTGTVIAAYYMKKFGAAHMEEKVERSVEKAREWVIDAKCKSQEDLNSRLLGLHLLGGSKAHIKKARTLVLKNQREGGGWAQLEDMDSDAYSTGQTLFVLQETGGSVTDSAYQRGLAFLNRNQLEDGSWHVKTRSKPIQTYYESGFPHGKDQFISISATSWAVSALAAAIEMQNEKTTESN